MGKTEAFAHARNKVPALLSLTLNSLRIFLQTFLLSAAALGSHACGFCGVLEVVQISNRQQHK